MATRARGTVRECPVQARKGTCGARVPAGRLMCATHWRQVPVGLRTDVLRAWGRWKRLMDAESWDEFVVAREAALDALGDLAAQSRTPDALP